MAGISPESASMLLGGNYEFTEPDDVAELADGQRLELAGLEVVVDHTPGHTAGSVSFRTPYGRDGISDVMFAGDLLFAGSIGRTDLPGGDHAVKLDTLRRKVLTLPDDVVVLPGVDDEALRARARRHDVAVRCPRTRGEAGDQHHGRLSTADDRDGIGARALPWPWLAWAVAGAAGTPDQNARPPTQREQL
jgi:glyoxylase-like metal-dependent hydrolase (beta-lactamase superfamily II)